MSSADSFNDLRPILRLIQPKRSNLQNHSVLKADQPRPQGLGVVIDVMSETLRDREPYVIRGQSQRPVLAERQMHGAGQRMHVISPDDFQRIFVTAGQKASLAMFCKMFVCAFGQEVAGRLFHRIEPQR